MNYPFMVTETISGAFELRFVDLIGARAIYSGQGKARQHALELFLEALQSRFEEKQFIPMPSQPEDDQMVLCLPESVVQQIREHNAEMDRLGQLQDVSE